MSGLYIYVLQRTNLVVKSWRLKSVESVIFLRCSRFPWKHVQMVHVLQSFCTGQQLVLFLFSSFWSSESGVVSRRSSSVVV